MRGITAGSIAAGWRPASRTRTAPETATKDVALLQEAAPAPVTVAEPAPTKDAALVGDLSAVPGETAYATDVVNLRAGPSESSEVLRVLPLGGPVTITGAPSEGWTPVWYNGTAGYISADLLSASTTAPRQPGAGGGAGRRRRSSPRTRPPRAVPESWRRPRSAMSTCAGRRR